MRRVSFFFLAYFFLAYLEYSANVSMLQVALPVLVFFPVGLFVLIVCRPGLFYLALVLRYLYAHALPANNSRISAISIFV